MLGVLIALVALIQFVFPNHLRLASGYNNYVFRPFQSFRNLVFDAVPFSVGDLLYLIGLFAAIATLVRWIYLLTKLRTMAHELAYSLFNTAITLVTIYLLFFVGWGGNYYRPTLSRFWQLPAIQAHPKDILLPYDSLLVSRLNALAPAYQGLPFKTTNRRARAYFLKLTNARTELIGIKAKASLFGHFMQYLGIQGYYNPFTGEAQVNHMLPEFMLPFVVCHEMAHQSGIAAEDDANLLAYAICTSAPDSAFVYSGYFNLWLYAQSRLRRIDSTAANNLFARLNPLSHSQVDTLRAIRKKYRSGLSEYSMELYDRYLRLHDQKEGIESYTHVVFSAWLWEQRKAKDEAIRIP